MVFKMLFPFPPPQSVLPETPACCVPLPAYHSRLAGKASGLNAGGLIWIVDAQGPGPQFWPWFAVGPPCLQILNSPIWVP